MTRAERTGRPLSGALLFVPARERLIAKLPGLRADGVVIDLEDAILPDDRSRAREQTRAALESFQREFPVLVRVNALGHGGEEDLAALADAPLDGLMLAKVSGPRAVDDFAAAVDGAWQGPSPGLIPLLENARGVVEVGAVLGHRSVAAVALGGEDLAADLGVARTDEGSELLLARQMIALHAHAHGVVAIDTPYLDLLDRPGLARDTRASAALGFSARLCIHPDQVETVRIALAPSEAQREWAARVLERAGEDVANGLGVTVLEGRMLDAPVVRQARLILERGARRGDG